MRTRNSVNETDAKFLIACIVAGLEYMHSNGVLHRDIKPENLLMGEDGYIRITDMGISKMWAPDNANDTSGTPGYMAPEIMCRQNHGVAVDFYALGIIAYELMIGKRPYTGKDRKEIRDNVLKEQASIKKSMIPEGWSIEAADFINKLIQRKPANRLGLNGSEELKQHVWLKNFDWEELLQKKMEPAFIPSKRPPVKPKVLNTEEEEKHEKEQEEYYQMCRRKSIQAIYQDYIFDIEQLKFQKLQEMRQKIYLKNAVKQEEDTQTVTTQFAIETQHTSYVNLEK
jgi:protein kinase A